jgi:hypothetical protein
MDSVGVDVGLRLGHDERKKATDSRVPPVSDKRTKERRGCWTSGGSAELGRCGAVRPTRQARGKQPRPDGPRREGGRAIGLPGHFAQVSCFIFFSSFFSLFVCFQTISNKIF